MYRTFEASQCTAKDFYRLSMSLVVPRPIAWISTYNQAEGVNLAPYALFSVASTEPLIVQFSSRRPKDTYHNALREGAFAVNFASTDQKELVSQSSKELPPDVSESLQLGLSWQPGQAVNAPILEGVRASMECTVHGTYQVGGAVLTFGTVQAIHIAEEILARDGLVDPAKLAPLAKLGGPWWGATVAFQKGKPCD